MKKDIHPKYYRDVKVTCACGNTFVTGSTVEAITTELCSKCHPFYTGELKIVDSENLVAKFRERQGKAQASFRSKREKLAQKKAKLSQSEKSSTLTLKDMLSSIAK